jgi:hypothetical protein
MIGLNVHASGNVNPSGGKIRYSGIDWSARLSNDAGIETIADQELCTIVGVEGTVILVSCSRNATLLVFVWP